MKHEVGNGNGPVIAASEAEKPLTPEQRLREKVDGAGGPLPAVELQQFRGEYEKTVDAPILPGFPGASIGENLARLIAGEEISGLKLDRLDVLKELAEDVAREAVIHLAMEGVGDLLEVDELALHEIDLGEIAGEPVGLARPLEIHTTQPALNRVFPSHELDDLSGFLDDLAQETARRCASLDRFREALEENNTLDAGRIFHEEAKKALDRWVEQEPERLPKGWTYSAEKTIQSGKGGSRADVLIERPGTGAIDFDWKSSGQSALTKRAVDQMDKHMAQLYEGKLSLVPLRVESRSWKDYIPQALKEWGFLDDLAQETARRCASLDRFREALEENNTLDAGRIFHEEAKKALDRWVEQEPERLPIGWTYSAEKTIQSGKGGSRADVLIERPGTGAIDFDWKSSGQSALTKRAVDQMDKHMAQLYEGKLSLVPLRVESRSWKDYIPQALKEWGEREAGEAAMKNDLNQQAVQQEQNTAARNTEASNSVQEQLKQSRAALERASSDASQTVNSASSEIKRNNENLEGWLQNQPDLELSNAADAVQQVAQEALNKAQEVAQSIFQMVEAALQPNNTSDIRQDSQKIVDAALNTSRDLQRFAADVHETNQRATETAADALFAGKQQEARQAMQDAEQQMTQMRDRAMDDMRRTTESIEAAQIEQARSEAARVEQRRQEQEREAQR